jgi:hypothetical protein
MCTVDADQEWMLLQRRDLSTRLDCEKASDWAAVVTFVLHSASIRR